MIDASNSGIRRNTGFTDEVHSAINMEAISDKNLKTASDFLFIKFWDRFAADCERKIHESLNSDLRSIIPGEIFINLRGVVVNATVSASVPEEPKDLIKKYQQFITRGGFDNDDRDFVATRILNDSAVFVSPFGANIQNDITNHNGHNRPKRITRFTILNSRRINPHHLGRCITNILDIFTLMIAAIKEVHTIRQIGTQIRLAGDELNDINKSFSDSVRIVGAPPWNLEKKSCHLRPGLIISPHFRLED